jgi:hypothetical protein
MSGHLGEAMVWKTARVRACVVVLSVYGNAGGGR